jgi:amino acid adenylation domain-containing protein
MGQSILPESTQYILCAYYKIPLDLEANRFIAATDWIYSHHDALYARLTQGHEGVPELVLDPANAPRCQFLDLSGEPNPQEAFEQLLARQAGVPFRMLDSSLAFPMLVKTGIGSFYYFSRHHHIVIDGWAVGIVFSRICEAYEDMGKGATPRMGAGRSFAAYLAECRQPQEDRSSGKARAFWGPLLAIPAAPLLPAHSGGDKEDKTAASYVEGTLTRELADQVSGVAAAANATLFHALLLAYSYLISRQYSLESCAVDLPILNRSKDYKETIGLFTEMRTVPLPLDEHATIGENLTAFARRIREMFRYYRVPVAELARLGPAHGTAVTTNHSSVSYISKNYCASIDGVAIPMRNLPPAHERHPFTFYVLDIYPTQDIRIEFVYQRRHMNQEEAGLFLRRFLFFLTGLCAHPKSKLCDMDLVPPEERRRLASVLRRDETPCSAPRPIIHEILERARLAPAAIAVETLKAQHSYGACIAHAKTLAHALVGQHGVIPGDRIALLLPRGPELIASYLAVMLVGGTFVPLEPHGPEIRASEICADCGAKCVITLASLGDRARALLLPVLVADEIVASVEGFAPLAEPEQTAYIIYTSGSTGKPKGVEITHRALTEHIASWFLTVPLRTGGGRILFFHTPAFDSSIESIFPFLMRGHTIVPAPHPQWTIYELPRVIMELRLTFLCLPPAYLLEMLKHLRDNPEILAGHRVELCMSGGDVMHAATAALWPAVFGPAALLYNVYGPTEATVTATAFDVPVGYRVAPGESVPIGRVHAGRILRIVNERGQDVPLGAEGELLIGGLGLAKGYYGMPQETKERFVVLEDGVRYYRSGDVVRLQSDGLLVFRRRLDRQIKIRGYRVEPGEIEACLLTHKVVREGAVVVCDRASDGEKELRAYVALFAGSGQDGETVRTYLEARLPSYMIPSIAVLERLPKSVSGKIDRRALLTASITPAASRPGAAPGSALQGPVQEYLATLWREVLGKSVSDARADFFVLGGHSLLAAKLIAKIGNAFRVDFPFSDFFDDPTIEATERKLEQLIGSKPRLEKMARLRNELSGLSPTEIAARL